MILSADIVHNGGAGGGETAHGLKKGIKVGRQRAGEVVRQGTEDGDAEPGTDDDDENFPLRRRFTAVAGQQEHDSTANNSDNGGGGQRTSGGFASNYTK